MDPSSLKCRSISALPPEITSHIIANIDSKSSLSSLALCSRDLKIITTPHLYRNIQLWGHDSSGVGRPTTRLRKLTSLLTERPDLAKNIRQFTMRDWFSCEGKSEEGCQVEVPDRSIKTAIKAVSQSEGEEQAWLKEVTWNKTTNEDAFLALLLLTLVNLEKLDINIDGQVHYVQRVMERAVQKEIQAFQKVRHILHTIAYNQWGMHPTFIALPLQLTSVKTIFGDRIYSKDFDEKRNLRNITTASSTVEHIELRESRLSSVDLANLLRAPIALKTFIYDITGGSDISDCGISSKGLHRALESQKNSLENIWLDSRHELGRWPWTEVDEAKPMPSFADFSKLKVFRIATTLLFGLNGPEAPCNYAWDPPTHRPLASLLPKSLHTFHLAQCGYNLAHHTRTLENVLLQKATYTPLLEKIMIEGSTIRWQNFLPSIRDLARVADEQKVSFMTLDDAGVLSKGERRGFSLTKNAVELGWRMDGSFQCAKANCHALRPPHLTVVNLS